MGMKLVAPVETRVSWGTALNTLSWAGFAALGYEAKDIGIPSTSTELIIEGATAAVTLLGTTGLYFLRRAPYAPVTVSRNDLTGQPYIQPPEA